MPSESGRRSRSTSLSGLVGPRQSSEFAALILAQGYQNGNLDLITQDSKALFPVANKPMLYYSIKQVEDVGFDKSEIYVAISGDDLKEYESDDRVVPIESRLPDANFIRVRHVESSLDTLRKAVREIEQRDGLPENLLVIYVDVVSCSVLSKMAELSRIHEPAMISVYAPRESGISREDLPGTENTHKTEKVTKLTFFDGESKDLRKLYLTIDTENYDDETIRLSNRVLSRANGHVEVTSDLDDQGIFLFRRDLIQWIIHSPDDMNKVSIRDDLIPEMIKQQYQPYSDDFSSPENLDFIGIIDDTGTARLDSIDHLLAANKKIVAKELLTNWVANTRPSLKNCDVDDATIFGDNVIRFNDAETERLVKEELVCKNDACTKLIIRKSLLGPRCRLEYEAKDDKKKITSISNSFIMSDVSISVGCKIRNCIIASGAKINAQCTLANCIIGPGVVVEKGKNLKNQTMEQE